MSAAEMVIYSVLSYLPYIALALFPFKNDLRFSKRVTVLLVIVSGIFQILIGLWAGLWGGNSALLSFISTVTYFVFYFTVVKVHFGKTLFTLLTLSNIANFVVISSKCIEGALFPENAMQGYRWSFSLIMVLVQAALLIPLWFYIRSTYTTVMEKDAAKPTWRFLWLIPATFYVEWLQQQRKVFAGACTRAGKHDFPFFYKSGRCIYLPHGSLPHQGDRGEHRAFRTEPRSANSAFAV